MKSLHNTFLGRETAEWRTDPEILQGKVGKF